MTRSITVIINPISGGASPAIASARADLAARVLGERGVTPEILITERAGHARELAATAVARGAERVCAWGGDGTLNEVASALAFTDATLGIVPAGSGNGLARELGISTRPEVALGDAITLPPRPIDVGELGGRLFINVAGVGLDAYIAALFNAPENARRGLVAYSRLAVDAMLRYAASEYRIETTSRRWTTRALLIVLANSAQWGNGARIAPGAEIDDGRLDLVVVGDRRPWTLAWNLPRLFTGTVPRMRGTVVDRIERVSIESAKPIPFHVDGEPAMGGTRLEGRVRPAAIRVAAGQSTRRG